jgi:DNA-directed RNA polymerase subunit RPC12/RpoP
MNIEFECKDCGQLLSIDEANSGEEAKCPKCGSGFIIPTASAAPAQAVAEKASGAVEGKVTKSALIGSGAAVGAIFGAIVFAVFLLMDRFFFGGSESARYGLIVSLIIGVLFGAVWGAIVGIATVMVRSVAAGIAAGAVLFAVIKVFVMQAVGLGGGWSVLGFVVGLIYGAIFATVVAQSVIRSIKWDKLVE